MLLKGLSRISSRRYLPSHGEPVQITRPTIFFTVLDDSRKITNRRLESLDFSILSRINVLIVRLFLYNIFSSNHLSTILANEKLKTKVGINKYLRYIIRCQNFYSHQRGDKVQKIEFPFPVKKGIASILHETP